MSCAPVRGPVAGALQERPPLADRPAVVVYTHSLLGSSMTFIASHAAALRRYDAVYAGSRRVAGLELPEGRAYAANTGGPVGLVREYLFRRYGIAGALAEKLRPFVPALVHAHFGQSGPAALDLASALSVPMIVTYHGQDATMTESQALQSWRGREFMRGRRRVMECSARIIAVSDFIRSRLLEHGYPAGKVVTHRNGIDLGFFRRRPDQPREELVVFVGRFVEKKGCEFLIRALGALRGRKAQARAVLIGDGPLRANLEELASRVGANVEFPGFLGIAEVKDWLARASVVVVPSVTAADGNSEGLPTVILEAQAMATPVVATRHAGNAEGLDEGRSALLVDERDVDGLADAIQVFLDNPSVVEEFGRRGRSVVESRFDLHSQVAGLERIYDEARASA